MFPKIFFEIGPNVVTNCWQILWIFQTHFPTVQANGHLEGSSLRKFSGIETNLLLSNHELIKTYISSQPLSLYRSFLSAKTLKRNDEFDYSISSVYHIIIIVSRFLFQLDGYVKSELYHKGRGVLGCGCSISSVKHIIIIVSRCLFQLDGYVKSELYHFEVGDVLGCGCFISSVYHIIIIIVSRFLWHLFWDINLNSSRIFKSMEVNLFFNIFNIVSNSLICVDETVSLHFRNADLLTAYQKPTLASQQGMKIKRGPSFLPNINWICIQEKVILPILVRNTTRWLQSTTFLSTVGVNKHQAKGGLTFLLKSFPKKTYMT